MLDVLIDALVDSLKMLPFLFAAYLLIEFLEHKASRKMRDSLQRLGPFGPVGGALLGVVPQCGFSVAASNFYAGRIISVGTLLAVFLSTSDEAIPVLLAHPDMLPYAVPMLLIKVVSGMVFGFLVDFLMRRFMKPREEAPFEELCASCDCGHHGIVHSALRHTVEIFAFILLVNLILGYAIYFIGEENISKLLLNGSVFQPFLTALIGLLPNCAASVILTELFAVGSLEFGSCVAGLCAGAGLGLVVLFRTNHRLKENLAIVGVLYAASVITGLIVNLF
ncbi:MAG: putative manganese transporter [Hominenteromicrobium sp.]